MVIVFAKSDWQTPRDSLPDSSSGEQNRCHTPKPTLKLCVGMINRCQSIPQNSARGVDPAGYNPQGPSRMGSDCTNLRENGMRVLRTANLATRSGLAPRQLGDDRQSGDDSAYESGKPPPS